MILTYLFFFLLIFISFYIPGYLLLLLLKVRLSGFERHIFSLLVGTILFLVLSYLFALADVPQLTLIIIELCLLLFLFKEQLWLVKQRKHREHPNIITYVWRDIKNRVKEMKRLKTKLSVPHLITLIILLLGAICFTAIHFFSGLQTTDGIRFLGIHAVVGIEHLSSIKQLVFQGLESSMLGSWYDLLLSRFMLFYGFTAEDLYFRLFPLFNMLLLGGFLYLLFRQFTKHVRIIQALLLCSLFLLCVFSYRAVYVSHPPLQVSPYDARLYTYFAKEVDTDEFIIYLPSDRKNQPTLISALTGRQVHPANKQLQEALRQCNENELKKLLHMIGSHYILSEGKNTCLMSEKIRGIKVASKTLQFYIID